MERVVSDSLADRRLSFILLSVFAVLALVLASAGAYGGISYLVNQRTREFGVRIAMGAQASDVVGMVMRESMLLVGAGLVVGIAGALAATQLLTKALVNVKPTDITVFGGVAALLALVVVLASAIPALRATRVDPVRALRWE